MNIKSSINKKLMLLVIIPAFACTSIAVIIAGIKIRDNGYEALVDKSNAILSRMEAVRDYTANRGLIHDLIDKYTIQFPNGNLPESEKEIVKQQVPIIASWMVGEKYSTRDNYTFKVSAINARLPKHEATEEETEFINNFKNEGVESINYIDKKTNTLWVMRPVRLKESEGCMLCHGAPATSPFKNGKDILGYPMENYPNNTLKGMFIIKSDLKPVQQQVRSTILSISLLGLLVSIIAIFTGIAIVRHIVQTIKQIITVSEQISNGNLTSKVEINSNDELGILATYINQMVENLNNVIKNVKENSSNISATSFGLKQNSMAVASGASAQASSTEQVSSSMEEMTANVEQNTENAKETEIISKKASLEIIESSKNVRDAVDSMKLIAEKVSIIGEIAFQTNILALNAAVEAARSGVHGRGFAVVATEVRKLAERSRNAASEIDNVSKITVNKAVVAAELLENLVPKIQKTSSLVQEITTASVEQSAGINQINNAIQQLNNVTQQNALIADQLTLSSNELNNKAKDLQNLVDFFTEKKS